MAVVAIAQPPAGAKLKIVPSEALDGPLYAPSQEPPKKETPVRPAILTLKPAGDPIYLETEPAPGVDRDKWRTYQRPKVERFSKDGEGIAIRGYDLISYQEGHAETGRKEFTHEYEGVEWRFTSAEHRNLFRQDPQRYLPEYGGFCAYSLGRGYPATADPKMFEVDGARLYLFFDQAARFVWKQDRLRSIAAADKAWPKLHR